MTTYSTLITFVLLTFAGLASASEKDILGNWINQAGDGLIEISVQDSKYIGTIIGGANEEAE